MNQCFEFVRVQYEASYCTCKYDIVSTVARLTVGWQPTRNVTSSVFDLKQNKAWDSSTLSPLNTIEYSTVLQYVSIGENSTVPDASDGNKKDVLQ